MAMFDSSARAAQSVGRLARVFWLSLPAALLGLAPAAWAQSYLPVGPQNNVPVATVTAGGWTECHRDTYNNSPASWASVQAGCAGARLMLACRATGSSTLQLLAQAPRADVLTDTGTDQTTTHTANGSAWYWNSSRSWGFAREGDAVRKHECDDRTDGDNSARLCWHSVSVSTTTGFRCGADDLLGTSLFERIIYAMPAAADLAITKTDGVTTAAAGGSLTYTITASNAGPDAAVGATVADTFPAVLTGTWTCVGAGGGSCTASGNGNINDTVNLPVGGSVTYTVLAAVSAAATGTLSNTATVAAPAGVTDPNPANNSATDTDTIVRIADLAITKTDGVTTATAGGGVTYTITASNAGPAGVTGATVADTFPASLTGTWTCVGAGGGSCTASGNGNINDTVNLPVGASVTYTVVAAVSAAASGTLANTATVAAPAGVTDPNPANNSATDTDTIVRIADLAITKTDGVTIATAGGGVTYTIVASNAGPSAAVGATVADTFPASLTGTWTCVGAGGGSCTASGSGNINDTVNLPVGGSVTYTVVAAVSAAASGTLSNTATVAVPATGYVDPNPANNSATDTDTIARMADLAITKTDGVTTATAGGGVTYTIVASNAGPSAAVGATVADTFPAVLTGTWTCVGAGGGTCTASGSGNINDTVNLPVGGSVTYTVSAMVSASATGTLSNTATVAAPAGMTDPNPANNSATDTDTITQSGDLSVTLTGTAGPVSPGAAVSYTLIASNPGPSPATGVGVSATFPAQLQGLTWTCVGATGGTCAASGGPALADTVNLPVGATATYTITGTVAPGAAVGDASLSAALTAPAGYADPDTLNNTAAAVTTIAALAAVPGLSDWPLALLALLLAGGTAVVQRWRR